MPSNYVLLNQQTLTQSASSVTFSDIPQTGYTDLKIELSTRNTSSGTGWSDLFLNVNGQGASTNITIRHLYSTGSGVGTNTGGAGSSVGNVNPNGNTANSFATTILYFPNYTTSTKKSFSSEAVSEQLSSQALTSVSAGLWNQTAAITSLSFTTDAGQSFAAGSTFSLYGIAALGTSPTFSPKASGGDIIKNDGTYWYHAFTSSGTFTPQTALSCTVLSVGGGGGGGGLGSSGGGGGVIPASSVSFNSATNYALTIGAGGSGVAANDLSTNGGRGTDTTIVHSAGTITAYGGGGGVAYSPPSDPSSKNGGSGGGGGGSASQYAGGTGVAGQGYAGGNSLNNADIRGGGGGGYSGAGGNATSSTGGNGGQGYNLPSAYQSILIGHTYVGSGAGGPCRASVGTSGTSGTGAGVPTNNGTNASNPTMFGCAGAATGQSAGSQPFGAASAGYSGVVVIRYPMV